MISTTEAFAQHVASHAGSTEEQATRATRLVLARIGSHVSAETRRFLATELPARLAAALSDTDDLAVAPDERVREPPMRIGQAHELIASVCRVLAEELSTEAIDRIRVEVPASLAQLLSPPGGEVVGRTPSAAGYESLASGHPGSRHPIADTPGSRAQADSVADAGGHEDTKLSTAPGTTQERAHTTLAEGRPGFERELSGETPRPRR
ncbi:MAG TPA: DUF2267 domain-containing protein [Kofleriaceae bacterium]|nr:DUF2267 domain-containing protein [Kofleriaceae bacterium]